MERNEKLAYARKSRGWSQARVAQEIGTQAMRVSSWERGEFSPSPHFQEKLCAVFDMDAEALGFLQPRPLVLVASQDVTMDMLDHAESIIDLSWEAWFAARPGRVTQEITKLLPKLYRIHQKAPAPLQQLRAQQLAIRCHGLLGTVYLDGMYNDPALYHYLQAQTLAEEIHDLDQATTYLALIGDVLRRKGQKIEAISRMELARDQAMHAERATRGHILQLLAYTQADTGNAHEFDTTIEQATDMLAHSGGGLDSAQKEFIPFEIYEITGKANRDLGRPLQALPYLDLAEKSLENKIVTPRWHALLTISRSQAFCDAGDMEVGTALAKRGFIMAHQCQSPRQMNRVRKLARKLGQSEHKEDKRVLDLKELLLDHYLSE